MKVLNILLLTTLACVGWVVAEETAENEALLEELESIVERGLKNKFKGFTKTRKNRASRALACPAAHALPSVKSDEKRCRRDKQCETGEKCCDSFDKKHCFKGIVKRPRPGQCPKITMFNDACIAGHKNCRYDGECSGEDEKCCMNTNCGYKECLSVRQNIACPQNKLFFNTDRTEKECTKDVECRINERCCDWSGKKHCLTGISTIETPGFCPAPVEQPNPNCKQDFSGCDYDAECSGVNHKCCMDYNCHYRECVDMNRDFSCPDLDPESSTVIDTPSTCSVDNSKCEGFGQLCCAAGVNKAGNPVFQCTPGVINTPKPGQCPDPKVLLDPNGECLADYDGGCQYDNDCFGEHKCCETSCGYKECLQIPSVKISDSDLLKRVITLLKEES